MASTQTNSSDSDVSKLSDQFTDTQHRIAYEELLADCCHYDGILSVLMQHRPYFEALPSVRRPEVSVVAVPLPNVRSREKEETGGIIDTRYHIRPLPCDIALMMCDPEWKIKTGIEIVLFIQRPDEDFSDLLSRWRRTQVELGQGVEWVMPRKHKHLLAEGTETPHPLFVVFVPEQGEPSAQSARILRGLTGASLPVATWSLPSTTTTSDTAALQANEPGQANEPEQANEPDSSEPDSSTSDSSEPA